MSQPKTIYAYPASTWSVFPNTNLHESEYNLITRDEIDDLKANSEMLNWLIFHSATVCHSKDGDDCWIMWSDHNHESQMTSISSDPIMAIKEAMSV